MRVLHVVPTYLPAVRYGGPIQSVHALCRALAAQGHMTDVFTTNVDGPGDSDVPHDGWTLTPETVARVNAAAVSRVLVRSLTSMTLPRQAPRVVGALE